MAEDGKKPLVFISHKHQDVEIAKALTSWLQVATRNGVEVFQSSDGFKDGPSLGRSLTEEIRSKAHDAAAMLVLYTDAEQDWEWVMFEVGIGLDPSTPETRVVLVQCGPESPHVLRERMRVDVRDASSCIRFAKELLTTSFFDGFPPLADFESTFIERVAAQLQKDLEPILPKDVAMRRGRRIRGCGSVSSTETASRSTRISCGREPKWCLTPTIGSPTRSSTFRASSISPSTI